MATKIIRYITEFCNLKETLLSEYEISNFNLSDFQHEFDENDLNNPMYDCYKVKESNTSFLKKHLIKEPKWDFESKTYYLECGGL